MCGLHVLQKAVRKAGGEWLLLSRQKSYCTCEKNNFDASVGTLEKHGHCTEFEERLPAAMLEPGLDLSSFFDLSCNITEIQ